MKHIFIHCALLLSLAGCGYGLQNSRSPLRDKEDIYTVYIEPFSNATYKPGAENVVYNSVVRAISAGRRIKIVYNRDDADAVIFGSVRSAEISAYSDTYIFNLSPAGLGELVTPGKDLISTYEGSLTCSFRMNRAYNQNSKSAEIWSGAFTSKKPFATSARLGPQGVTTALINETEFDRAILELSDRIADDMHESMLAMF